MSQRAEVGLARSFRTAVHNGSRLSAPNVTWLHEAATLFRRGHDKNGLHAGFILYTANAARKRQELLSSSFDP